MKVLFLIIILTLISCKDSSTPSDTKKIMDEIQSTYGFTYTFEQFTGDKELLEGSEAKINIKLKTQPKNPVRIYIERDNNDQVELSTSYLDFTPLNWNANDHTIKIKAINNNDADGDFNYILSLRDVNIIDSNYSNLNPDDITIKIIDNDIPRIILNSSLYSHEAYVSVNYLLPFSIALTTIPESNVKITFESTNPEEGELVINTITITPDKWNAVNNTLHIRPIDDNIADGDQTYNINITSVVSDDNNYNGLHVNPISIINTDNDEAGMIISQESSYTNYQFTSFYISEFHNYEKKIYIHLKSRPVEPVTISASSPETDEFTILKKEFILQPEDWRSGSSQNYITVKAVDDFIIDGEQSSSLNINTKSDDPRYNNLSFLLNARIGDNDYAGLILSDSKIIINSGNSKTVSVALRSQPSEEVVLSLSIFKDNLLIEDGPIKKDKSNLSFDNSNWSTPQHFIVTAEEINITTAETYFLKFTVDNCTTRDGILIGPIHYCNSSISQITIGHVPNP